MADAYQDAIRILEDNREMLDKIAGYLLEKETITGQEMMAILEGRDPALVDNYGATPEPRRRDLTGDVEPPARAIHMISEAPVNPFTDPSQQVEEDNHNPDTPEEDGSPDTDTEESTSATDVYKRQELSSWTIKAITIRTARAEGRKRV